MKKLLLWTIGAVAISAEAQVVKNQGFLPFGDAPIHYRSQDLKDPVAVLQQRLDRGEVKLDYDAEHGYLQSILKLLRIPVNSQTLVFSKTSFQFPYITPASPRALYFNDDVYVGEVHNSKAIEFVSFDPTQGAIFYILDEHKVDKPQFERSALDCIQCHVATTTRGIPGVMVRSAYTNKTGYPAGGTPNYTSGHESPLEERWGGWYVTGTTGKQLHMGNQIVADPKQPLQLDRAAGTNVTSIADKLDISRYLTPHSDVTAHLVLAHQTQMHNVITLTNYQTRIALAKGPITDVTRRQYEGPAEQLVQYLLFANEVPLTDQVKGTSGFAEQFAALGPRDAKGRSLRDFDLKKRIFRNPCSYLIYSEAFDSIPEPALSFVYQRLFAVLSGSDQSPEYASLSKEDRKAVLEILLATKPGVQEKWNQFVSRLNINP